MPYGASLSNTTFSGVLSPPLDIWPLLVTLRAVSPGAGTARTAAVAAAGADPAQSHGHAGACGSKASTAASGAPALACGVGIAASAGA